MKITQVSGLTGTITIPGDKSISHRSVMFGALAKGRTEIHGFLPGADCLSTISCFRHMGVEITQQDDTVTVHGNGLHGLKPPAQILDCGNSGTTTRLLSGILAAQPFESTLTGDESIQSRPMLRIIEPLSMMGADITSQAGNNCAPLRIKGTQLHGIHYHSKVASAQVKSAILLAGLYADGKTSVTEPYLSRNHTEIMLAHFGANIESHDTTATITPASELYGNQINVPGDISSAAFFLAAGLIVPDSEIILKNVGLNPTRDGILQVCRQMGGNIEIISSSGSSGETAGDLLVRSSRLHGITIEGAIIPTLIDELPMIAAMACLAEGTTVIKDAQELKVKESNRIRVMVDHLTAMGADIIETDDGMVIHGGKPLHGAVIESNGDHRIAMTFAIAGLVASGTTEINGFDCVRVSYPDFYSHLKYLIDK